MSPLLSCSGLSKRLPNIYDIDISLLWLTEDESKVALLKTPRTSDKGLKKIQAEPDLKASYLRYRLCRPRKYQAIFPGREINDSSHPPSGDFSLQQV